MARPWSAASVLMLALAAFALPPSSAQDAGTTTWYVHGLTSPDGAGSYLDHLPPTDDEVDQTTTATGSIGGDPYVTHSEAEDPLPSALAAGAGESSAKVWVKSWNNGPAPATRVTVTVSADGAPIATGSLAQNVLNGAIVEYLVPLELSVDAVPAGAIVTLDVALEDDTCGCYNPFAYPRGTSPDHPWQFTLALVAAAGGDEGPAEPEVLEAGPVAALNATFANATSEVRSYSWNTTLSNASVQLNVTGNGTVLLNVTDGNGTVVLEERVESPANRTLNITGAVPGNWSITLAFKEFAGAVDLVVGELRAATNGTSGPAGTGTSSATNSTSGSQERTGTFPLRYAEKPAPGLGVPLLLLSAAAVALLVRRRLA